MMTMMKTKNVFTTMTAQEVKAATAWESVSIEINSSIESNFILLFFINAFDL